MKLAAAVIVRNEGDRYLEAFLRHLLEFVDEIRVLDDGSTDGWQEAFPDPRIAIRQGSTRDDGSVAFNHHAAARNQLLQHTLAGEPTHILAIDADEFVSDGASVRRACERGRGLEWSLVMEECWELCDDAICVREDGGWASHPVGMLWRPLPGRHYVIADQGHATGRVPQGIAGGPVVSDVLHLGWANRAERAARYQRYAVGDGGRFHSAAHIQSIMWPDSAVTCRARPWPTALEPYRPALVERARR